MTTYSQPEQGTTLHEDHPVTPGDIAVGVVIGRASEYFDFFVFGIGCVLVFPALLFPFASPLEGTLYSFVIFSLAFLARPVGTTVALHLQRRSGVRIKLTLSLFLLGICTVGMAFMPSYNSVGAWAIVILSLLRIGQGIAMGGSWDGMSSLLAMNAPKEKRGWFAMLGQLGAPLGFAVAASLFAYLYHSMSTEEFIAWGWRYPFFVAFAINVVALFARIGLVTGFSAAMHERALEPLPVSKLINEEGNLLMLGAFASLASYALFHLVTIFPLSWAYLHTEIDITHLLLVQILGALLCAGGIVASGYLADRFGRRTTLRNVAIAIGVFALISPFLLHDSASGSYAFVLVGFTLLGLSYGQSSGTVTSNFSPKARYTGAALTTDLAWLFGAAFAPLVVQGLSSRFGTVAVGIYLLSGVACTLGALAINRNLEARRSSIAL